jgi:hypothetical protein
MPEKYAHAGLVILVDALAVTAVSAVLALLYWLVTGAGGDYLAIVSNLLFFEGGIILTFGALLEFFHLKQTQEIRRMLFSPLPLLERLGVGKAAGDDKKDEEQGAGWLLVFLGATLILFSIIASLQYLI